MVVNAMSGRRCMKVKLMLFRNVTSMKYDWNVLYGRDGEQRGNETMWCMTKIERLFEKDLFTSNYKRCSLVWVFLTK